MFEQEYHTLCLGDEMPEISFHPETPLLMPEDDFATNTDSPFKIWSLDDTLEKELSKDHSLISGPKNGNENDIPEHQLIFRDKMNGQQTDDFQNNGTSTELHVVEKLSEDKIFVCPVCNENTTSFSKLFSHMQIHSGKLQCSICSKTYPDRSHLRVHIQRHLKIRPYHCQECKFTSTDRYDLILHINRHRNERKFECTFCNKKFFRRIELSYHKKYVHLHSDKIQCKLCSFTAHSRNILNYHNIRKHQTKKKFQCPKCLVVLQHKYSLIIHMRIHTGEKPFFCIKCKKSFKSKSEISSHSKNHEVSSTKCTICKREFSRKGNLLQHMAMHTMEKVYSCNLCSYKSFWKSTLARHVKLVHKLDISITKPDQAMNDKHLNYGESINHIETLVPNKAEQSVFEHKSNKYMMDASRKNKCHRIHSCAECNKVFKKKSDLNSHMYVHMEKKFECKICNRMFKTKSNLHRHSYCHTDLKPFSCKFCPYTSNLKTSITRHMTSVHSVKNIL